MLGEIRRGHVGIVMVAALDRLGRTTLVVLDLVSTMTRYGVSLASAREGVDTTIPLGVFMVMLQPGWPGWSGSRNVTG